MSFLVTNRPIPKGCIDCWFKYDCTESVLLWHVPVAPARSPDCPLVPVPAHGRLIDEKDIITESGYIIADGMACIPIKYIAKSPTIIPAEEEKQS